MATSTPEPAPAPAPAPGTPPGINREAERSMLSIIRELDSESHIAPIIPPAAGHRTELPVFHEEYLPRHSLRTASGDSLALPKAQDVETGVPIIPVVPRRRRDAWIPGFPDRGSFMGCIRNAWLDVATQILCVLVSGAIWLFARPILPQVFPLYRGIETSAWGLKYGRPYRLELITTLASALLSFIVPFLIIGAVGLWGVRRFWESHAALLGLGYSLATTTLIVSVIKWIYGGLRPHFLAVCKPKILPTTFPTYYTAAEACTGSPWAVREVQMSFPSGHAAAAFAGFGYLALYLNAKYKAFGPKTNGDVGRVPHWKLLMFVLPWLFAVVIAASKVLDGWHHPADVIAGAIIGTILAHLAFKMVFRSVYDSRDNHVPRE